jgi:DNA-directed RNA polymerase specialized sigma24 family protein
MAGPGAANLELVSGVAQLRPEDVMVEAMLRGWRAQPRNWDPSHVDEWAQSLMTERHLAP